MSWRKCEKIVEAAAAGAELPMVIVDIMRGGPGLGNIAPEQGDYFQIVKGGGHGNYRVIVLAPNSAQEMCDLTIAGKEVRYEQYRLDDAQIVTVGDGIVSRLRRTAVDIVREKGIPAGLLRPITLWPFPSQKFDELTGEAHGFPVCELSTGQMLEDVKLAVNG